MEINVNRRCRRYSDLASVRYEHFMVVLSRDNGTKWMTAYHTSQIKGNRRFRRYTEPAHVAYVHFMVVLYGNNGTKWMTA